MLQPELTALVLGISAYTASFIAEIVRGGILAVSHGQTEAAYALGLSSSWRDPATGDHSAVVADHRAADDQPVSQCREEHDAGRHDRAIRTFTRSSATSLNQTGRPVENIAIMMTFFLTISILISLFMNWYNKRIALVER